MEVKDILVINPGSTSTKIAVYTENNSRTLINTNIVHDDKIINGFGSVGEQESYRRNTILSQMEQAGYDIKNLGAVVGRGGMAPELESGGYLVNEALCKRMASREIPQHASSLGAILAYSIASPLGISAYIYDSPMGSELLDVARITGIAGIERYAAVHVLNSRAKAREYAESIGKKYEYLRAVVCHMGGGITVNAQRGGKIIDAASYDDGPMAPERSGRIPLLLFEGLHTDGSHSPEEIKRLISGEGGLYSHLGTKNCMEVERRINEGDEYARLIYETMAFQIAKSIAEMTVCLKGDIDVIILTGGIANSKILTDMITANARYLGKIVVMPGEKELDALGDGAYRMMTGSEKIKEYEYEGN